jgi:hypothetical protein
VCGGRRAARKRGAVQRRVALGVASVDARARSHQQPHDRRLARGGRGVQRGAPACVGGVRVAGQQAAHQHLGVARRRGRVHAGRRVHRGHKERARARGDRRVKRLQTAAHYGA